MHFSTFYNAVKELLIKAGKKQHMMEGLSGRNHLKLTQLSLICLLMTFNWVIDSICRGTHEAGITINVYGKRHYQSPGTVVLKNTTKARAQVFLIRAG